MNTQTSENSLKTPPPAASIFATIVAGGLAAIGATACCFGPLLLVTLGLGGAWVSSLRALEAWQPLFVASTFGFIGFSFYKLYVHPRRCAPDDVCAVSAVISRQRLAFWIVVAIIATMFALPYFAHLLY